jgi:hypothetical protein
VSLADTARAIAMYKKLNIPTLGIIENMSYFVCGNCHHEADIFGHGGGEQMATDSACRSRPHSDLPADPRGQRQRRAADDQRARSPRRGVHGRGRAHAAQVSIASYNRPTIQLTVVNEVSTTEDRRLALTCAARASLLARRVCAGAADREHAGAGATMSRAIVDPYLKIQARCRRQHGGREAQRRRDRHGATALGAPAMKIDTAPCSSRSATEIEDAREKFGALSEAIDAYMTGLKLKRRKASESPSVRWCTSVASDASDRQPYFGKRCSPAAISGEHSFHQTHVGQRGSMCSSTRTRVPDRSR